MSELAHYECKRKCHVPISTQEHGVVMKLFIPQDIIGSVKDIDCKYQVPAGELVPHHFTPINDVAEADREDQISNPEAYISTDYDMGVIAELMVDSGFYDDETFYDQQRGKYVVKKPAKRVAQESIRDTIGEDKYRALLKGEKFAEDYKARDDLIKRFVALGKKAVLKELRDNDIKKGYFPGQAVEKLAAFAVDKGLEPPE